MIRRLLAVSAGLLTAVLMSGVPGLAADTDATITVSSTGSLAISGPSGSAVSIGSADYDSAETQTTWSTTEAADMTTLQSTLAGESDLHGKLGTVTVTDGRTGVIPSWNATVSWTPFKLDGTGSASSEIIEAANLRYASGDVTTSGAGLNLQLTPVTSGDTAVSYTGVELLDSTITTSWSPTIYVDLVDEQAGTYSGTITHSVTGS